MSTPAPFLGPVPLIGSGTTIASDALAGTDPPVSIPTFNSNWSLVTTSSLSVGALGAQVYTAGIAFNAALYNATFPNDQFVQFTVTRLSGAAGYFGGVVRGSVGASGLNGYTIGVNSAGLVITVVTNNASTAQLFSTTVNPPVVGDVFRFSAIGLSLFLEKNGVLIWRGWNNGNWASGSAGLYGANVTPSSAVNNWSAGSVVYTVPTPGFLATPGFINAASGATNNVWRTVNVVTDISGGAGPPLGMSGVIMMWSSPNSTTLIARPTGSTFNVQPPVGNAPAAGTQGIFHTGVTLSGSPQVASFDFIASNVTGLQFWTAGYYGPEAVFFDPPIAITVPGTFPGVINLAAQIPASAVAIIANLWGDTTRIVPHGDADIVNYHPTGLNTQSVVCGVVSQQIDITAATGTTPVLYLRGYLKYGFTWRTPPAVVTPGTAGSMQLVAAAPGGYVGTPSGFIYEVNGTVAYSLTGGFPSGGTFKPVVGTTPQSGNAQGVGAAPQAVANVTAGLVLAEQGYFVATAPATAPTAATKAYLAVKTTSQS